MKQELKDYAVLGLVHHMLYPECMNDADLHVRTLADFVRREDIETFDCCLPYGEERRVECVSAIQNCGKIDIVYAVHLFPYKKLKLAAENVCEFNQSCIIIADQLKQAARIGATGFIFAAGAPAPAEASPRNYEAFAQFCRWMCKELKQNDMLALLEPFDTKVDKKFLYGSSDDCIGLIKSLEPEIDNLAIELDAAHIPLMGETFEHAIKTCAPYLRRVHLGNCVLDKSSDRYGDTHPPIGYQDGVIDVEETAEILRCLLEVGFLNKNKRGSICIEMTPWPGRSVEDTIQDSFERVHKAWKLVANSH